MLTRTKKKEWKWATTCVFHASFIGVQQYRRRDVYITASSDWLVHCKIVDFSCFPCILGSSKPLKKSWFFSAKMLPNFVVLFFWGNQCFVNYGICQLFCAQAFKCLVLCRQESTTGHSRLLPNDCTTYSQSLFKPLSRSLQCQFVLEISCSYPPNDC